MAAIPYYGPWALPVGCYSIVVRHDAVIRSFPGGVKEFERVHQPVRSDWVLFMLIALSEEALHLVLARLAEADLRPGVDVAVADKLRRPILGCPGVTFEKEPGSVHTGWKVGLGPDALHGPDEAEAPSPPQAPLEAAVAEVAPAPWEPGEWATLDRREAYGAFDSWNEYLCAARTDRGFVLDVFGHAWLGEVPHNWYDDDGELLPEHQDADGDLKLPEEWNGCQVMGLMDGGFVGELQSTGDDPVKLGVLTEASVRDALERLDWHGSAVFEVLAGLQKLTPGPRPS